MARPHPYLLVTSLSLAVVACQPRDPLVEAPLRIDLAPVAPASWARHWASSGAQRAPGFSGEVTVADATRHMSESAASIPPGSAAPAGRMAVQRPI